MTRFFRHPTSLHRLCKNLLFNNEGSFDEIRSWLKHHEHPRERLLRAANETDDKHNTPLHFLLATCPPADLVKELIQLAPSSLGVKNSNRDLPLHIACKSLASLDVVNKLRHEYGLSPIAARPPHDHVSKWVSIDVLKLLLKNNPRATEVPDGHGMLPLHYACKYGAPPDVIDLIVNAFPDGITKRDTSGKIPLDHLTDGLYSEELKSLLAPQTFIELSSCQGSIKELYALCKLAWYQGGGEQSFEKIGLWLNNNKKNHDHLKKSAKYEDKYGRTPLHWLVRARPHPFLVETLIKLAPKKNYQDNIFGEFPLHWACRYDASPDVIKILIEQTPKAVKLQDRFGMLPLHRVCIFGPSTDVVKLLVDAFPESTSKKDNEGRLPLDYTLVKGSDLCYVLRSAALPAPHRNAIRRDTHIYTENKTDRILWVEYHQSLKHRSLKKVEVNVGGKFGVPDAADVGVDVGVAVELAQNKHTDVAAHGARPIGLNETCSFPVRHDCEGISFDILCHTKDTHGWALNYFIEKGYTQEIAGHPVELHGF